MSATATATIQLPELPVIHAVDKIQRLMKERKQIYDQVTDLVQRLKKA